MPPAISRLRRTTTVPPSLPVAYPFQLAGRILGACDGLPLSVWGASSMDSVNSLCFPDGCYPFLVPLRWMLAIPSVPQMDAMNS